jgi:hypothetical protein
MASLLRRGFNELYMALTVSNRCVEDAQAETGKAGSETSALKYKMNSQFFGGNKF